MSTTEDITIVPSSGNIYADLGLPNPEERCTKAALARQIDAILTERKLTQRAAARILGIPQPKVSNLLNGRLSGFSVERLLAFLTALNRDVQIVVTPTEDVAQRGEITVTVRQRLEPMAARSREA
ncbi:MAG: helix-turn-helix domain-containing protein [Thermomicrobiales bacterium]